MWLAGVLLLLGALFIVWISNASGFPQYDFMKGAGSGYAIRNMSPHGKPDVYVEFGVFKRPWSDVVSRASKELIADGWSADLSETSINVFAMKKDDYTVRILAVPRIGQYQNRPPVFPTAVEFQRNAGLQDRIKVWYRDWQARRRHSKK